MEIVDKPDGRFSNGSNSARLKSVADSARRATAIMHLEFSEDFQPMLILSQVLQGLLGIGSLVCFILVIIKMFQVGEQTMGIVCIVLVLCCIGGLVAFVYGWINANKWGITNIMWIWTGLIIGGIVLNIIALASGATMFPMQK
jgi:hypothetical protein